MESIRTVLEPLFNEAGQHYGESISLAVVQASSLDPIFDFNAGFLRLNESTTVPTCNDSNYTPSNSCRNLVDKDSIFRAGSLTKLLTILELYILEAEYIKERNTSHSLFRIRLAEVLPDLLPPTEAGPHNTRWEDITLEMLATHTAGFARQLGEFRVYDLKATVFPPDHTSTSIGAGGFASNLSIDALLEEVKLSGLAYEPATQARCKLELNFPHLKNDRRNTRANAFTDSNVGYALLALASMVIRQRWRNETLPWTEAVALDILEPLKLESSFFGSVPSSLASRVSIPDVINMIDRPVGEAYEPAIGLYTSTADLAKLIHRAFLWEALDEDDENPPLLPLLKQRESLTPSYLLHDGHSSLGRPWELESLDVLRPQVPLHREGTTDKQKSPSWALLAHHTLYSKTGALPGQFSYADLIPDLGYGVVCLSSQSNPDDLGYPTTILDLKQLALSTVHAFLVPGFAALEEQFLRQYFVGVYSSVNATSTGEAKVTFEDGILWLHHLDIKGISVLQKLDVMFWAVEGQRATRFPDGGRLAFASSSKAGGVRSTTFSVQRSHGCEWTEGSFATDARGHPLDQIRFEEDVEGASLVYDPLDVRLPRVRQDVSEAEESDSSRSSGDSHATLKSWLLRIILFALLILTFLAADGRCKRSAGQTRSTANSAISFNWSPETGTNCGE